MTQGFLSRDVRGERVQPPRPFCCYECGAVLRDAVERPDYDYADLQTDFWACDGQLREANAKLAWWIEHALFLSALLTQYDLEPREI